LFNLDPTITLGQLLMIGIPIGGTVFGAIGGFIMHYIIKKARAAIIREVVAKLSKSKKEHEELIKGTNELVVTLGEGFSTIRTELHEFRGYAEKHYVEMTDLAEVKTSFQNAMGELRDDIRTATATMMDVRDSVIVLTTKDGQTEVKPARRRTQPKAAS
jgi:hypothetical protein